MKRKSILFKVIFALISVFLCAAVPAGAADNASSAADAFAASYRQQKKAQHKEKILKVLHPSDDKSAVRSQEFVVRSLYDQAGLAYRQKDYQTSKRKLDELQHQLSQGILSGSARTNWSRKADALYKKVQYRETRQQEAAQREQERKKKLVKEKAASKMKPIPTPSKIADVPVAAKGQREDVLDMLKQRKQEIQTRRDNLQKEFKQGLEKMYDRAVTLYKAKDYMAARVVFQDVQQLSENYKGTRSYLKRLERLTAK